MLSKENGPFVGECPNKRIVFYRGMGKRFLIGSFEKYSYLLLHFPNIPVIILKCDMSPAEMHIKYNFEKRN